MIMALNIVVNRDTKNATYMAPFDRDYLIVGSGNLRVTYGVTGGSNCIYYNNTSAWTVDTLFDASGKVATAWTAVVSTDPFSSGNLQKLECFTEAYNMHGFNATGVYIFDPIKGLTDSPTGGDGRLFIGTTPNGSLKMKMDSKVRIIGEKYDLSFGDGLGAIGFGDGHVVTTQLLYPTMSTLTDSYLNPTGEANLIP